MDEEHDYDLVCPYWIDTDGYTNRDRLMFCCGVEFHMVLDGIMNDPKAFETVIMRENETRVRLAAARFNRECRIDQCDHSTDPKQEWSYVFIGKR